MGLVRCVLWRVVVSTASSSPRMGLSTHGGGTCQGSQVGGAVLCCAVLCCEVHAVFWVLRKCWANAIVIFFYLLYLYIILLSLFICFSTLSVIIFCLPSLLLYFFYLLYVYSFRQFVELLFIYFLCFLFWIPVFCIFFPQGPASQPTSLRNDQLYTEIVTLFYITIIIISQELPCVGQLVFCSLLIFLCSYVLISPYFVIFLCSYFSELSVSCSLARHRQQERGDESGTNHG